MTKKEQFQAWWLKNTGLHTEYSGPREIAEIAWNAARAEVRDNLMDLACQTFREGDTQRAKVVRDLADIRHSIWGE